MAVDPEDIRGSWRRLNKALQDARDAEPVSTGTDLEDAVIHALDEMYRLSEAWKRNAGLTNAGQNAIASGDADGETALALVFARGENTHHLVRFEQGYGFGTQPFGTSPFGGGWYFIRSPQWQSPTNNTWAPERTSWYGRHVSDKPVVDTLEKARRWFAKVVPPRP